MNERFQDNISTAGTIAATVATVTLLVIALLPRPFAPMDHLAILAGFVHLSAAQLVAYKSYVSSNLMADSIYLLAHSVMWFALSHLVSASSIRLGSLVLAFGLFGAGLDFLENELRWAAMTTLTAGNLPAPSYVAIWQTVFGLSFWALFIASLFTGVGVARLSRWGNVVAIWSLIGILVAAAIFKTGFLPSFLWLIVWHVVCACLLWGSRAIRIT